MRLTINYVNGSFWYQPTIFSVSRRGWVAKPYKNLKRLLESEKLLEKNFVFVTNGDRELKTFSMLNQYSGVPLSLRKADVEQIELTGKPFDVDLTGLRCIARIDKRGLKLIKSGTLPFYAPAFYRDYDFGTNKKRERVLLWRRSGWIPA